MHWLLLFFSLFSATAQESRATLLADQLTAQGNYAKPKLRIPNCSSRDPANPTFFLNADPSAWCSAVTPKRGRTSKRRSLANNSRPLLP